MLTRSADEVRPPKTLVLRYSEQLQRILDRGQAELALTQTSKLEKVDALMRAIVQQSFDGILSFGPDGLVATANEAAARIFRCPGESLVGCRLAQLFPGLDGFRRIDADPSADAADGIRLEGQGRRPDNTTLPVELSLRETLVEGERVLIAIVRDITRAKAHEQELRHQALHDALTGLPNRVLLHDRLQQAVRAASRTGQPFALLLLDLDRFKSINDTLGHQVGDLMLVNVARRLAGCIREGDTIARLGGDEFAVLLPAPAELERAADVARRIVSAVREPFEVIEGLSLEVGISIGIALFPEHARCEAKLMQCADVAMYAAKISTSEIQSYERDKDHNNVRTLTLTGALRQAIEGDQMSFDYQPKLDLRTRRICSVEALARWHHPEHGPIRPAEFVPQIEQTGLIQAFTHWTFATAFAQLAAWQQAGINISISVNLSARSLHEEELPTMVESLLQRWQVEPRNMILELTESAVMLDPGGALRILHRLHALGLRLSIDDFGTGYSSLSHLQRLPLDELKIDQSFVRHMTSNEADLMIVRSTIGLAQNLGLTVVAEGLENETQLGLLHDLGCDQGQGFFVSAPRPMTELSAWLADMPWGLGRAA